MTIRSEIEKIAGATTKDGMYYEMQGLTQYDENGNMITHYDNEDIWYRVAIISPTGMVIKFKEFGGDMSRAYRYLKGRR